MLRVSYTAKPHSLLPERLQSCVHSLHVAVVPAGKAQLEEWTNSDLVRHDAACFVWVPTSSSQWVLAGRTEMARRHDDDVCQVSCIDCESQSLPSRQVPWLNGRAALAGLGVSLQLPAAAGDAAVRLSASGWVPAAAQGRRRSCLTLGYLWKLTHSNARLPAPRPSHVAQQLFDWTRPPPSYRWLLLLLLYYTSAGTESARCTVTVHPPSEMIVESMCRLAPGCLQRT